MIFKDRETAHREMIRQATEEFERTMQLPHLTLVENPTTGIYTILRGEPSCENGMAEKVGEISVN